MSVQTVLIVEDDHDTRSIYASALRDHGYRVLTASHGAEGVHLARRNTPDLILLDIRMPVMDGWAAARYLKAYQNTQNVPICAISAYELQEGEMETTAREHFDCFLMKPIEARELVADIERRIGPPSAHAGPPGASSAQGSRTGMLPRDR